MTEIVIKIKQLSYPGRMASNPFIESHHMCMVFPLSNDFIIENGHFRLKHKTNGQESLKSIGNRCTHGAMLLVLIGKHAYHKGYIRHVTIRTWCKPSQVILVVFLIVNSKKIVKVVCSHCIGRKLALSSFLLLCKLTKGPYPLERCTAAQRESVFSCWATESVVKY